MVDGHKSLEDVDSTNKQAFGEFGVKGIVPFHKEPPPPHANDATSFARVVIGPGCFDFAGFQRATWLEDLAIHGETFIKRLGVVSSQGTDQHGRSPPSGL